MIRRVHPLVFCLGLATLTLSGAHAAAPGKFAKISRDSVTALPSDRMPVIIQYKNDPGPREEFVVSRLGGTVHASMHSIHAHAASLTRSAIEELASDPNVRYISPDRKLAARGSLSSSSIPAQTAANYTVEPLRIPQVWAQGYDGSGIGIAVIDSGIQDHADLHPGSVWQQPVLNFSGTKPAVLLAGKTGPGRVVWQQNFVVDNKGQVSGDAGDHYGHGTHVAGLIGGNGRQSTGNQYFRTFKGAAPNVNLIDLRVLDQNGSGTDSQVIAAIEQAIALKNYFNIRVINLSLGRPIWESYTVDPLCQAVERAWKAGIVVVVAAGNDGRDLNLNPEGYGTIEAPGNDPYVITVGAMNTMGTQQINDDIIASYSSKGPSFIDQVAKPDVVAPGNLVTSLEFGGDPLAQQNPAFVTPMGFYTAQGNQTQASNQYFPLSGTSMATGVVSGAVALLLQAQPQLMPDQVKAELMRTADNTHFPANSRVTDPATGIVYVANYDPFTVGAGYLNVNAALNDVQNRTAIPDGNAMSPVATYDPSSGNVVLVTDQHALWGSAGMWSASQIYGASSFITNSHALWGSSVLWNSNDPSSFTALWGAHALWGSGSESAAHALWGSTTVDGQSSDWAADATVVYPF